MRFLGALVCWLAATVALAVAVPALWAQYNVIDEDGYTRLAERAAQDPNLQAAMAAELTARATALVTERSGGTGSVDSSRIRFVANAFTSGPAFPPLFAQVNRAAHSWLFSAPHAGGDQLVIDVAPMLNDGSLREMLNGYRVTVPDTLTVPLTVTDAQPLRQGELHPWAVWGPRLSHGADAVCAVSGLLTLVLARRRGKALTGLGISALLVGAAGWAGLEMVSRYLNVALNRTTGDIRRVADVMVGHAESSLHLWLNLTLGAGVVVVLLGVLVAAMGGLAGRRTS
ncbi:hypothetical protein A5645_21420 [Mycobacterium asiaticum]|uniref:hypothetical protein n=1 Tax=Mycobacterium asiaticum TaxID=1790 RepID=UPI0007EF859F|nr:hypothetical protein [Mycobacterium asiaticum]OBK93473.1 hypothetical protein A5645_21420 [Mycobacterium asiaticum]